MCESSADSLVRALIVCSVLSWMIGVCVFGLALGTVKDDVFVLEKRTDLAPLFEIACADVATAVFIWILTILGAFTLVNRTASLHISYITGLTLSLLLQLCCGISTLVICASKIEGWRKLTKTFCELNYNPRRMAYIALGGVEKLSTSEAERQSSEPLQILLGAADRSMLDCNQFNDLMTPAGALLIVGSILHLVILPLAVCLYQRDQTGPPVQKPGARCGPTAVPLQEPLRNMN